MLVRPLQSQVRSERGIGRIYIAGPNDCHEHDWKIRQFVIIRSVVFFADPKAMHFLHQAKGVKLLPHVTDTSAEAR